MTRTRTKRAAAEEAAQDEAGTREALKDPATVPDDLTAAAQALRQAASDAGERAVQCRAEAESVVAASRADAERIISEGQARALPLIAAAGAFERQAVALGGRSKHHEHAARQEALLEADEAKAAELAAELERVTETIAGLDSKLSERAADRERYAAAVAAGRIAGEVSVIDEGRRKLNATMEAMEGLSEQRDDAMARARQLGDGTETGPGELLDALTKAETHRNTLTEALDELYPDRPGAEHRRTLRGLKSALEGNLARIADERSAAQQPQRPNFVHP